MRKVMRKVMMNILGILPYGIRMAAFKELQRSLRTTAAERFIAAKKEIPGGLFSGVKLPPNVSTQNFTLAHLLGNYELQVQEIIRQYMPRFTRFVDVGCASGFYTVGIGKVFGKPAVGYDIDGVQVEFANQLAVLNGLSEVSHHQVDTTKNYADTFRAGDLVMLDVEGAEFNIVSDLPDALRASLGFVIEMHEAENTSCAQMHEKIAKLLDDTHHHVMVHEKLDINFADMISHNLDLSRNDVVYFSNNQRDFFQTWGVFIPRHLNV